LLVRSPLLLVLVIVISVSSTIRVFYPIVLYLAKLLLDTVVSILLLPILAPLFFVSFDLFTEKFLLLNQRLLKLGVLLVKLVKLNL